MSNSKVLRCLDRDQPWLSRVFSWHDQVIVKTKNGFLRIDIESAAALPVKSPGDRETTDLASYQGQPVALCHEGGGSYLFSLGSGWKMEKLRHSKETDAPNGAMRARRATTRISQ